MQIKVRRRERPVVILSVQIRTLRSPLIVATTENLLNSGESAERWISILHNNAVRGFTSSDVQVYDVASVRSGHVTRTPGEALTLLYGLWAIAEQSEFDYRSAVARALVCLFDLQQVSEIARVFVPVGVRVVLAFVPLPIAAVCRSA